jgi:TrmH family RNA methyltransferase
VSGPEPLTVRSARVKAARKLTRRASRTSARRFLVEGPQAVREALGHTGHDGRGVQEVFVTAAAATRHSDLAAAADAGAVDWHIVDDEAMTALTDTVRPQGVVAVCDFVDIPLDVALAAQPDLVVVCADIRDPGNAGTVIRCADAAGAGVVVLAGHSVDPFNGKAVRASAGSLFHLSIVVGVGVEAAVDAVRGHGLQVLAADGAGGTDLDELLDGGHLERRTAWMFGNEAWGLPDRVSALADAVVRIPIYGRAESLNLATAAAVCLYASARAQRHGGPGGRGLQ